MPPVPSYPKKPPVKPGVQMRQLHWGKLADAKIKGTIWESEISDEKVVIDKSELEATFAAVAAKSSGAEAEASNSTKAVGAGTKKVEVVTLLDPKTSNNTAIALSRFRKSPEQIASAILSGEEMPADQISSLLAILPSPEDAELVQGYDGDTSMLGKAEAFFLAIAAVPRYTARTKALQVRATFAERHHELSSKIEDVAEAVNEVRSSKALKVVLEHALALGNYLNGGTSKGSAWGFKLDSLNKLIGTKTLDGKSTLLHYLARKLATKGIIDQLGDELEHVEPAARIVWKDEVGEVSALETAVKLVETQVKLDKNDAFKASMGTFHSSAKVKVEASVALKIKTNEACTSMLKWFGEDVKTQPEEVFSALHNFLLTLEKGHRYNIECDEKVAKAKRQEETRLAMQQRNRDRSISGSSKAPSLRPGGGGASDAPKLGVPSWQKPKGVDNTSGPGPKPAGIGVDAELAAKLARRNNPPQSPGKTDLVDGCARVAHAPSHIHGVHPYVSTLKPTPQSCADSACLCFPHRPTKAMANGVRVRQLSFDRRKTGSSKGGQSSAAQRSAMFGGR